MEVVAVKVVDSSSGMVQGQVVPHGSIVADRSIAIEELPQAGKGLHDWRQGGGGVVLEEPRGEL